MNFLSLVIIAATQFTAQRMEIENRPEGRTTVLEGKVEIVDGPNRISAQTARLYHTQGVFHLHGAVLIQTPDSRIEADSAIYHLNERSANLWGEVVVHKEEELIYAQELIMDQAQELALIPGPVRIVNQKEDLKISGSRASHDLRKQYLKIEHNPMLEKGEVQITAQYMEFYDQTRTAQAVGRVKLSSEDVALSCDTLGYWLDEAMGVAVGRPILRQSSGWVQGDSMRLFLGDERLDSLWVIEGCQGEYRTEGGERIVVAGALMELKFTEGKLDRLTIHRPRQGILYLASKEP
jgi:lipopolysaccharide export system protein LptA